MPSSYRLLDRTEYRVSALQTRLATSATGVVIAAVDLLWQTEVSATAAEQETEFLWNLINTVADGPSDQVRVRFSVEASGDVTAQFDPPRASPFRQFVGVSTRREGPSVVIELLGLPETEIAGYVLDVASIPANAAVELTVTLDDLDPAFRAAPNPGPA